MPVTPANARYIKSLHAPGIPGFKWMPPQDKLDELIYRDILVEGCSILSFSGTSTSPEFTYSVGLYLNFRQPEILLMGLHPDTARSIVLKIRDGAAQGTLTGAAAVRDDLFDDHRPVRFLPVPQERFLDYVGRNCSFYFSLFLLPPASHDFRFPVLQGIWPDRHGFFPDQEGCDSRMTAIHRLQSQSENQRLIMP